MLKDLSGRCRRQCIKQDDLRWSVVGSQLTLEEIRQVGGAGLRSPDQLDEGHDFLVALHRAADHRRLHDVLVRVQDRLDLRRIHVEPGANDHLLRPTM